MKTCRECGHAIEEAQDVIDRNVFVWTGMALFVFVLSGCMAWGRPLSWWIDRSHVVIADLVCMGGAIYWWRKWMIARKGKP